MFICEECNMVLKPHRPQYKIVKERRQKKYKNTVKKGNGTIREFLTVGWEIIKELKICEVCYERSKKN